METLTNSLSFDTQIVEFDEKIINVESKSQPIQPFVQQPVAIIGSSALECLSSSVFPDEHSIVFEEDWLKPHPLIISDRQNAESLMEKIIEEAEMLYEQLVGPIENGIVCPYEKTIAQYLGANPIIPTIHELVIPENFCPVEAIKDIVTIDRKYYDLMLTHLQTITAEAADTGFVGITSQNLGNAFAILSTTSVGQERLLDKPRLASHLSFAELIRTLPDEYITENAIEVAHKLVNRFIEIHK